MALGGGIGATPGSTIMPGRGILIGGAGATAAAAAAEITAGAAGGGGGGRGGGVWMTGSRLRLRGIAIVGPRTGGVNGITGGRIS